MTSPEAVYSILCEVLEAEDAIDRDKEHFWVLHLDSRHRIKALELVALGTLTMAIVAPREVFTRAVTIRCAAIIIAHNHPSGDPTPSDEDVRLTERLMQAGNILDIQVIDHIIVGAERFASLRELGHMKGG